MIKATAWRFDSNDAIDRFMSMSYLFWLHLAAVMSLVPIGTHALLRTSRGRVFWISISFATCVLLAWVVHRMTLAGAFGFTATLDLIVVGVLIAFMTVSSFNRHSGALVPLVLLYCLPLAFISLLTDFLTEPGGPVFDPAAVDAWFWLHIVIGMAAFSLITLAAIAGIAVWLKERQLKRRSHSDFVAQLPSVIEGEGLQFRLLQVCALLLGAGVATGMGASYAETGSLFVLDHKNVLSVVAFFTIVFMLFAHQRFGLRGRQAVRLVLFANLLLALGYPGVKFVSEILM